jgi:hypothetical protein
MKPKHPFANLPYPVVPLSEIGNVGRVCKACGSMRHVPAHVLENPPAWFVGQFCKLKFYSLNRMNTENMWVECKGVCQDGDSLWGELDNSPVFPMKLRRGSRVNFMRAEILDLREGGS